MRDFFIQSLEKLVTLIAVVMIVGVVLGALGALFSAGGGILPALAVLIGGGVYVIMVVGVLYLALGIHDNTRRTADAVEALARRE